MVTLRRAGFTLIELLVVLAILATLLTIALPRYFSSVDRSREAVLRQNLATLRDAIDKFYSDAGRYPEAIDELVQKRYLRTAPLDPVTDSSETWIVVPPPPDGAERGRVYDVKSGAPGSSRAGTPYLDW
jgi:general secretion pathway protein G